MAEKLKIMPIAKLPFMQALILAGVSSFVWLYAHCAIQYLIFRGGGASSDMDWGLLTILPAWILSIIVAAWVSWPLSRRIIGKASISGFIAGGILPTPISFIIGMIKQEIFYECTNGQGLGCLLVKVFSIVGFFGVLPEGRSHWAAFHALNFMAILVLGFVGYMVSVHSSGRVVKAVQALMLGILMALPSGVSAYDVTTHGALLTEEAITLLNNLSPSKYYEFEKMAQVIAQGAKDEDGWVNPRTHFYSPITGSGIAGFASARERLLGQDSFGTNFALESVALYKQPGKKEDAYKYLGHVLHLASQDMYSVPHVYLDQHMFFDYTDTYEDWVVKHYSQILNDARHSGSSVPTYVWPPTAVQTNAALYTYNRARIAGGLNKDFSTPATGDLAQMFPSLTYLGDQCVLYDTETGMCVKYDKVWSIPDYGKCYESSGLNGDPGVAEVWWSVGGGYFYFELPGKIVPATYNNIPNTSLLAELWALGDTNRFLSNAQADSAGVIKAFAKAVDQVVPTIELRKNDAQGELIPTDGSGFGGETIYIKINDPAGNEPGGNPSYPVPAGIYKIEIKNNNSGNIFGPTPAIPAEGENPVERTLTGLEEGPYTLTAYDGPAEWGQVFTFDLIKPDRMVSG